MEGYCYRTLIVGKTSTLNFYQYNTANITSDHIVSWEWRRGGRGGFTSGVGCILGGPMPGETPPSAPRWRAWSASGSDEDRGVADSLASTHPCQSSTPTTTAALDTRRRSARAPWRCSRPT